MEQETGRAVEHVHTWTPGLGLVRVKLERGQRGGYAWELNAEVPLRPGETQADAFERALAALDGTDSALRKKYLDGAAAGGEQ